MAHYIRVIIKACLTDSLELHATNWNCTTKILTHNYNSIKISRINTKLPRNLPRFTVTLTISIYLVKQYLILNTHLHSIIYFLCSEILDNHYDLGSPKINHKIWVKDTPTCIKFSHCNKSLNRDSSTPHAHKHTRRKILVHPSPVYKIGFILELHFLTDQIDEFLD